jgi:mono/diheme cytochrome c family protein
LSRIMILVSFCLLVSCGLMLANKAPLSASEQTWTHRDGELLMAASHCDACHHTDDAALDRLAPSPAPNLAGIGWRASPTWLREWIASPHGLRPGTRMPNVLAGFDEEKRTDIAEDISHYLMTFGGGFTVPESRPKDWDIDRGEELFATLGCRACHEQGVDGALTRKTDLGNLAGFLMDPLHNRPAALMPDMKLTRDESWAVSAYLLRDQLDGDSAETLTRSGLKVSVYELDTPLQALPDWDALQAVLVTSADQVDVSPATRPEHFGLLFQGEVFIESGGDTRFYTVSDDGSRLWINNELVADNDGLHGAQPANGSIALEAGWHTLTVEMFEASGDEVLAAGFLNENSEQRPFESQQLRHTTLRVPPIGHEDTDIDSWKVTWGKIWFEKMRCAACHTLPGATAKSAPDLAELRDLEDGCLSEDVPSRLPDYRFDNNERAALREVLQHQRSLSAPLQPTERAERSMEQFGCLQCHSRGNHRGAEGAVRAAFSASADLGDEGRLPPDLTHVGRRLRPEWLTTVIADGVSVRPSMNARMPSFGHQAVAALIEALPEADGAHRSASPSRSIAGQAEVAHSIPAEQLISAGRELVGDGGLGCISCHSVAGHKGPGLPGIDLALTTTRMNREAFDLWMHEPLAQRPGTRMPSYFDEGRSALPSVLDGDASAQIDAIWSYLSLGDDLPLPTGLIVDRASYDVLPIDRPRLVSLFMDGLSARVLAVGYPERVSLAFDLASVRLGKIWRGEFLNMKGTWRGRGGQLQRPVGEFSRDLPPGPALAPLDAIPWPEETDRAAGWRMDGHERDARGLPTFQYSRGGLTVEETYTPIFAPDSGRLLRQLTLSGPLAEQYVLRAAVSETIAADGHSDDGARFVCDDGLTVIVRSGQVTVRQTSSGAELLVAPTPDSNGVLTIAAELNW